MARNIMKEGIAENNYYRGLRGGKPFSTTNSSLASATKIINHHLFGTGSGPRHYTGTSIESKLSLSIDSIDGEAESFIDKRASKSILKKSDSSNNYYNNVNDSDTEKLITDNASTITMCDNETNTCDIFTNANGTKVKQQPVSPLLSKQVLDSIFRTNNNFEKENEADQAIEKNCATKISRSIFDDVLEEEKHAQDETMTENKNKEERKRSKRVEELTKDSQTMLICSLRPHKKKSSCEEKRKAKTAGHSCTATTTTTTTTNCLPQEHHFSS